MSMNPEYSSTACRQYEAALEDHLHGELSGAEAAELAGHLKSCSGCRAALDDAVLSTRLLAVAEPAADPGPGFSHMVMARIRSELHSQEGKSVWQSFVSFAWRFAATAAFALVLLVTFDVSRHNQYQQDQSLLATNKLPELVPDHSSVPASADDVLLLMAETDHGK
ncbi:MAG: zf-HC2 domain-containing protein [Candidatus Acidiferrales bacterium]